MAGRTPIDKYRNKRLLDLQLLDLEAALIVDCGFTIGVDARPGIGLAGQAAIDAAVAVHFERREGMRSQGVARVIAARGGRYL